MTIQQGVKIDKSWPKNFLPWLIGLEFKNYILSGVMSTKKHLTHTTNIKNMGHVKYGTRLRAVGNHGCI
jgi:hypothetical protein